MKKVTVYSTPACPYCKMAKDYLKEKGIKYTEIDVSQNENVQQELVKKSGAMSVPVIEVDKTIIIGFDKEKLNQELDIKK